MSTTTDPAAFFGHLAEDCRFAWANETPVQGVDDIRGLVGRMLARVSGFRHDIIIEQLVGEDSAALRMDVTYTLPHGGELPTPTTTSRGRAGRARHALAHLRRPTTITAFPRCPHEKGNR